MQEEIKETVDDKLLAACKNFDYEQIQELIAMGGDVQKVHRGNPSWGFEGNSTTCLHVAIQANGDEKKQVDVIELLFKNGAKANFKAEYGSWNHSEEIATFILAQRTMGQFKENENKLRLLRLFVENGADINMQDVKRRDKGAWSRDKRSYFLIDLINQCDLGPKSEDLANKQSEMEQYEQQISERDKTLKQQFLEKTGLQMSLQGKKKKRMKAEETKAADSVEPEKMDLVFLEKVLEMGFDVNVIASWNYWENYSDQYDGIGNRINGAEDIQTKTSPLHLAIMHNNLSLLNSLIKKGAKVDTNLVYTYQKMVERTPEVKQAHKESCQGTYKSNKDEMHQLRKYVFELEVAMKIKENPDQKDKILEEAQGEIKDILAWYEGKETYGEEIKFQYEQHLEMDLEDLKQEHDSYNYQYKLISYSCFEYEQLHLNEEDTLPYPMLHDIHVTMSCLTLAKKLEVNQEIIKALEDAGAKDHYQEEEAEAADQQME